MSVNISVSNKTQKNCDHILEKLIRTDINCRIIETKSIVDKDIENGCLITFGEQYNSKKEVKKLWDIIKDDYTCSHLKIEGLFDGCILNYIHANFCK